MKFMKGIYMHMYNCLNPYLKKGTIFLASFSAILNP